MDQEMKKKSNNRLSASGDLEERIEGLDAIRKAIDPKMSRRTFFRKWRRHVDPILLEYERWWLRDPPVRFFTFRRLLYARMLEKRKI
jgi:hypothetical protein